MCGAQMNYNTDLDYLKYNSAMLQTNHYINMCSCSRRKPIPKEANVKTAWLAHISLQSCQSKLNKCPWKNFSPREISCNSLMNYSVQFSIDCSKPGFPVHHQLLEFAHTHGHRVGDAIQPTQPLSYPSPGLRSFPGSASFPMNQLFASGGQSIGVSASTSVLPMNIQD